MVAALPVAMNALLVQNLTVNTVLVIVMMGVNGSGIAKNINISGILGHLFGTTLAADMLVEADNMSVADITRCRSWETIKIPQFNDLLRSPINW